MLQIIPGLHTFIKLDDDDILGLIKQFHFV